MRKVKVRLFREWEHHSIAAIHGPSKAKACRGALRDAILCTRKVRLHYRYRGSGKRGFSLTRAAADAKEFPFHRTQTMEEQSDGCLIVRFHAGGALEVAWHLVTWGDSVFAIKPKKLRKSIAKSGKKKIL